MAATGYEFFTEEVLTGAIAGASTTVLTTVPASTRWEVHTFSAWVEFEAGASATFYFEVSDTAGANFRQVGPRFSKIPNGNVQYNLDVDREVQVPGTPVDESTDPKYVTNFKGLKLQGGQVIQVIDTGTGTEIDNLFLRITGIEETFI